MSETRFEVEKFPWLASWDVTSQYNECMSDGSITDSDVDAWIGANARQLEGADADVKWDAFKVEATWAETTFKLYRIAMQVSSLDAGRFQSETKQIIAKAKEQLQTTLRRYSSASGLGNHSVRILSEYYFQKLESREIQMTSISKALRMLGGGIGIVLRQDGDRIFIDAVLRDQSAQKAGLLPQDEIVKIGGTSTLRENGKPVVQPLISVRQLATSTTGELMDMVQAVIGGPLGSNVTLVVKRTVAETSQTLTRHVKRDYNLLPLLIGEGGEDSVLFVAGYAEKYKDPVFAAVSVWDR